jgi:hypothetical protein
MAAPLPNFTLHFHLVSRPARVLPLSVRSRSAALRPDGVRGCARASCARSTAGTSAVRPSPPRCGSRRRTTRKPPAAVRRPSACPCHLCWSPCVTHLKVTPKPSRMLSCRFDSRRAMLRTRPDTLARRRRGVSGQKLEATSRIDAAPLPSRPLPDEVGEESVKRCSRGGDGESCQLRINFLPLPTSLQVARPGRRGGRGLTAAFRRARPPDRSVPPAVAGGPLQSGRPVSHRPTRYRGWY